MQQSHMKPPKLWIIAGPNGAGKSTLADRYLKDRLPVVNPDNIARQINPALGSDMSSVALQAGREALQQQRHYLKRKVSFAIETTLTGKRELRLIQAAKAQGYNINLLFVGVNNPYMSMGRIATRITLGGHHVSAKDVNRRYPRSVKNLDAALKLAFVQQSRVKVLKNSFRVKMLGNHKAHATRYLPHFKYNIECEC